MKKCQHQSFLGDLGLSSPLVAHMHNDEVYNYTARSYSFSNAVSPYLAPEMPLSYGVLKPWLWIVVTHTKKVTYRTTPDLCPGGEHTELLSCGFCWNLILSILLKPALPHCGWRCENGAPHLHRCCQKWAVGFAYNAMRKSYARNL